MKNIILSILLIISLLFIGCTSPNNDYEAVKEKTSGAKISAEEAKQRLDSEEDIILVDVRTPEEYEQEHIKNAILLPLDTISEKASIIIPDKETVYFVYCRSGNRSATAAAQLVKMGYKNIYDLGGIKNWPYEKE